MSLTCPARYELNWLSSALDGFDKGYRYRAGGWDAWFGNGDDLPKYSVNIGAAWSIIAHHERHPQQWYFKLDSVICGGWICEAFDEKHIAETCGRESRVYRASCDTAPLAICRAALASTLTT